MRAASKGVLGQCHGFYGGLRTSCGDCARVWNRRRSSPQPYDTVLRAELPRTFSATAKRNLRMRAAVFLLTNYLPSLDGSFVQVRGGVSARRVPPPLWG